MKDIKKYKTLLPHLYFLAIPLVIFKNLFGRGYILALDMIFTPNMSFENLNGYGTYSEVLRDWILHQSAQIIPADIIQKIILFSIFYLSGIFMYRLLKSFNLHDFPSIVGATFYVFNPFIYTRLLAGHWAFLLGYALIPYFYTLLQDFFKIIQSQKSSSKSILIKTTCIWVIASIISIHHYALFAIVFAVFTSTKLILSKKINKRRIILKKSIILFLISTSISLLWIPFNLSNNQASLFSYEQLQFFAPTPDGQFGIIFNLLAFYGFWAEGTIGAMPKDALQVWYLVFFLLSAIALSTFLKRIYIQLKTKVQSNMSHNYLTIMLIGLIGIMLALGSFGMFRYIWILFYQKIPLLQPFRESQKFLSLYVFSFSVALGYGIAIFKELPTPSKMEGHISKIFKSPLRRFRGLIYIFLLTLIFTYTNSLFTLNNEFKLTNYPDSYYKLENITTANDKILILPWQPYSFYHFVNDGKGKQIANPAPSFFSADIISSVSLSELTNTTCDIEYRDTICLNTDDVGAVWQTQLKKNNINYVLLNKAHNYTDYAILQDIQGIEMIFEDEFGVIYKLSQTNI